MPESDAIDTPEAARPKRDRGTLVFTYFDGDRIVSADPTVIQQRLLDAVPGGDPAAIDRALMVIAANGTVGGKPEPDDVRLARFFAAIAAMLPIIAAGFGVRTFSEADGRGLLAQEQLELLGRFLGGLRPVATSEAPHSGSEQDRSIVPLDAERDGHGVAVGRPEMAATA